jgi:hypothetical protein
MGDHRHTSSPSDHLDRLRWGQPQTRDVGRAVATDEALESLLERFDVSAIEQSLRYVGTSNAAAASQSPYRAPFQRHSHLAQPLYHLASPFYPHILYRS